MLANALKVFLEGRKLFFYLIFLLKARKNEDSKQVKYFSFKTYAFKLT